jgi:two-component system LytT family sensor kinase
MRLKIHRGDKPVKMNAGTIKWRHHEIILVTAILVIMTAGYLWNMNQPAVNQTRELFESNRVSFNLYKNIIFPDLGLACAAYLIYLWITLYTLPRLLFPKKFEAGNSKISVSFSRIKLQGFAKKIIKEYAWLFLQLVLMIFILGTVYNTATYFKHQWQFNYPGFSIFFNKNNPKSQLDIPGGYFAAAAVIILYSLYIGVREIIIHAIIASKQREYNILICNKVSSFVLQLVCVPVVLQSFNIIHEKQFFVSYFLVIPALFAMFISNVYWLFPMKGDAPFFSKKILVPLLSTSFVYAIPLSVFIHEAIPVAFLYSWALQLFIVTPVTWG